MAESTTTPTTTRPGPWDPVRGTTHPWFAHSALPQRSRVPWPGGARTAVVVVVHLGAPEWEPDRPVRPQASGGRGAAPAPDVPRMSHREFGHRVGALRLADLLAGHGVVPALALDVLTAEHYPELLEELPSGEVLAAGLSAVRPVTAAMREAEEADYVALTLDRLEAALGTRPRGWLGPERSESARTPRLLAEAGLGYVAEWANDELPYPMTGAAAGLWSLPLSWELSDEAACFHRGVPTGTWTASVATAFDRLHREGDRLLALHLQPWLSGQAFRAADVDRLLCHLGTAPDTWLTTPGQVVAHHREAT